MFGEPTPGYDKLWGRFVIGENAMFVMSEKKEKYVVCLFDGTLVCKWHELTKSCFIDLLNIAGSIGDESPAIDTCLFVSRLNRASRRRLIHRDKAIGLSISRRNQQLVDRLVSNFGIIGGQLGDKLSKLGLVFGKASIVFQEQTVTIGNER
jgi:hypothetical protein